MEESWIQLDRRELSIIFFGLARYANEVDKNARNCADSNLAGNLRAHANETRELYTKTHDHIKALNNAPSPPQTKNEPTVRCKQEEAVKPESSAYSELCNMIGLSEAKAVIEQALDYYQAQKLYGGIGFEKICPSMHMVFCGNPGTAKTHVARLFARIMKENNLLYGEFYEVSRADLVGRYVGQTAPKVREVFQKAQGGVLFIDEAYALIDDRSGMFGDEAINTIVQELENVRGDTVVIFAGYPDKMKCFLQTNPGLRSRIAFTVPFGDYTAGELFAITEIMAKACNTILADGVWDKLMPIFRSAMEQPDFGNGRFARNLFEQAKLRQASRLVRTDPFRVTEADVITLTAADFDAPTEFVKKESRKIGF